MNLLHYCWIAAHLLFLVYLINSASIFKSLFVFSGLLTFFFINNRPFTFDLVGYDAFIQSPDLKTFEVGFAFLIYLLKFLLFDNPLLVIITIKLIIIFEVYYVYRVTISKKFTLVNLVVILMSLYIFLTTQNILRQGLMLPLAFLSAYLIFNKRLLIGIFLGILGIFIHKSMPLFFLVTLFPLLILKYSNKNFLFFLTSFSGFLFGLITYIILINTQSDNFIEFYLNFNDLEVGRTPFQLKYMLTLIFYFLTTYFMGPILKTKYIWLYCVRNFSYLFLFSFFLSPELFSRFMVFCYFLDMFIILLYPLQSKKIKISSAIIFLVYTFTPQVPNILTGFYDA